MLRLNRKNSEAIVITAGDDVIVVTVDKIHKGFVRLSIKAPEHVGVWRREIADQRKAK